MIIKTAFAGAVLALSAPAFAAPQYHDGAIVKYGDLDLASDGGIAQLQRRVHSAAQQSCGYVPPRGLGEQIRISACQDDFAARANAELQPALASAGRSDVKLAQNLARDAR